MPESTTKAHFDEPSVVGTEDDVLPAQNGDLTEVEPSRGEKMRKTRERKMRQLFEGKKYVILGEIHLSEDEQFQTPFGNKGRNGYVIKEVTTGQKLMMGETVLRKAHELYGSISGLPPKKEKRFRRTKAQKAADDVKRAAERDQAQARILAKFEAELQKKQGSA